jgi:hypothetical protein
MNRTIKLSSDSNNDDIIPKASCQELALQLANRLLCRYAWPWALCRHEHAALMGQIKQYFPL